MNSQQKIYEVSVIDIEDDLTRITGDRTLAKAHAQYS
ncbi:hypothetical protein SHLI107390_01700 [Shewanella livingstonensis]